ncbi:DUF1579 family protein [Nonomuraea endophytica]|uniref:DUF1579 domain-containing protein n=1 Tax=Nonomuraea endophytica TaxID=714136 RepID=A0A7W8EHG4_9ACTN|nr:DUF1579 family protein [Nonomuraea endophytica]MBB5079554.1 hypothetical protein [Nonomuraea endophytica]
MTNKQLDALAGHWNSRGTTVGDAVEISGTDAYEWLAGGHFLVHRVDVRMGEEKVEAIEMIGPYDPDSDSWPMRAFDSSGNYGTMRATVDDDGVWTFAGETERATLRIARDGGAMSAVWERTEDGTTWSHWMDMAFTKSA